MCDECEVVWAKIKVHGSKDLYIGPFYLPPDNHDPDYIGHLQKYLERIASNKSNSYA